MSHRHRSIFATSAALAVVLAGPTMAHGQVYDSPLFAVSFGDGVGRIPYIDHLAVKTAPAAWRAPIDAVLFVDETRAVAYVGPSTAEPKPTLIMTDFLSRSVRSLNVGLTEDSRNESLVAGYRPDRKSKETVVLLQVATGAQARLGIDLSTQLFAIVVSDAEVANTLGPIEIERVNVWQVEDAPTSVYSVPRDDKERPGPAYMRFARLLVRDFDGDGIKDLFIWERAFEFADAKVPGRRMPEIGGKDYVLRRERFLVALYRPSERSFAAPAVMDHVPPPPESAWMTLPGLRFEASISK